MIIEYRESNIRADEIVYQGGICFGSHSQATHLASCVSIILHSEKQKIGGLSHITGYPTEMPFNYPHQALDELNRLEHIHLIADPEYYLVGGSTKCRWVLDSTTKELDQRRIHYQVVDILGSYHRKVTIMPDESRIVIAKQPLLTFNAKDTI